MSTLCIGPRLRLFSDQTNAQRVGVMWRAVLLVLGGVITTMTGTATSAAEIKVIGSSGLRGIVPELARRFEADTGHKVAGDFEVIAASRRKINAGAVYDIAILSPAAIDELISQGKIIGDTRAAFGRTGLGVAIRKGAPKPDIGTADAFKRAMLAARTVGHSSEGLSGVGFLSVLDRLGITTEMKPKLRAFESKAHAAAVAAGDVELGVTGIGPILTMTGADFVGPLPPEVQVHVVFTAGINTAAAAPEAARAFLRFATSPAVAAVFQALGMEQG